MNPYFSHYTIAGFCSPFVFFFFVLKAETISLRLLIVDAVVVSMICALNEPLYVKHGTVSKTKIYQPNAPTIPLQFAFFKPTKQKQQQQKFNKN